MIRPLLAEDQQAWRDLFSAYGVFYETTFDEVTLEKVWMLLLTAGSGIDAIVSLTDEGTVVGFAHYRSHPDTFTGGRDWFLDDLYVTPDARGTGHARALIEHIAQLARDAGSPGTFRWITAADNERAQRLYDSVATKTTWLTYEMRP